MARSLAFWLENSQPKQDILNATSNNTDVELHFNYWSLGLENVDYLDIGVKLTSIGTFDSLNFYLPFDRSSFTYRAELGERVCADLELVSAIFNNPVDTLNTNKQSGVFDLTFSSSSSDSENKLRFFTQILEEKNEDLGGVKIFSINDNGKKGSVLKFPKELFNGKLDVDSYFRFRIILNKDSKKSISQIYKPEDSKITSHFETMEVVDFRVNEARNLPKKVRSFLNNKTHLKKVHFFLIRDASSEFKMSHSAYDRCRVLENDLWDKYLDEDSYTSNDTQMLIYHWKESGSVIDHFSAFAKFTKRNVTKSDLWKVAGIVVFLGVLGGLGANILWQYVPVAVQSVSSQLDSNNKDGTVRDTLNAADKAENQSQSPSAESIIMNEQASLKRPHKGERVE